MPEHVIWKFMVAAADCKLEMPKGGRLLCIDTQPDDIPNTERMILWALVSPTARLVNRRVVTYMTGKSVKPEDSTLPFIDTVMINNLVLHMFDGGESDIVEEATSDSNL